MDAVRFLCEKAVWGFLNPPIRTGCNDVEKSIASPDGKNVVREIRGPLAPFGRRCAGCPPIAPSASIHSLGRGAATHGRAGYMNADTSATTFVSPYVTPTRVLLRVRCRGRPPPRRPAWTGLLRWSVAADVREVVSEMRNPRWPPRISKTKLHFPKRHSAIERMPFGLFLNDRDVLILIDPRTEIATLFSGSRFRSYQFSRSVV